MAFTWSATTRSIVSFVNRVGGTDLDSTLRIARNEMSATPMLVDIFSQPFHLQVMDTDGAEVLNDAVMTLQRLNDMVGH